MSMDFKEPTIIMDIILQVGATFELSFTWKPDGETPIDLTGHTAAFRFAADHYSENLISDTTENGGITLGGALGTVDLVVAAADIDAIDVGVTKGIYDLDIITPAGKVYRLFRGNVHMEKKAP